MTRTGLPRSSPHFLFTLLTSCLLCSLPIFLLTSCFLFSLPVLHSHLLSVPLTSCSLSALPVYSPPFLFVILTSCFLFSLPVLSSHFLSALLTSCFLFSLPVFSPHFLFTPLPSDCSFVSSVSHVGGVSNGVSHDCLPLWPMLKRCNSTHEGQLSSSSSLN